MMTSKPCLHTVIFSAMVLNTLRNPMETLYRRLLAGQAALKAERDFAEWLIEKVPAMVKTSS